MTSIEFAAIASLVLLSFFIFYISLIKERQQEATLRNQIKSYYENSIRYLNETALYNVSVR